MRVVLQRVSEATVSVAGSPVGSIGPGLCLLVGIGPDDSGVEIEAALDKICGLRVFSDESGQMNLSVADVGGGVLVVSQFTLFGDVSRGRRPSFSGAGEPQHARDLLELMVAGFAERGLQVETGRFGARMELALVNDGPVTLILEFRQGKVLSPGYL